MADWPTLADLKLELNVNTDARDSVLSEALAAAIEQVQTDTAGSPGAFEDASEGLEITSSFNRAALLLAVTVAKSPDAPYGIAAVFDTGGLKVAANHPTYERLLTGGRHSFGVG